MSVYSHLLAKPGITLILNAAYFVILVAVSIGLTLLCRRYVKVMDHANARSSHAGAVPRSGGIAIIATYCLGIVAYYFLRNVYFDGMTPFWGLFVASMIVAAVGFYDDMTGKGMMYKIGCQVLGVTILVAFGLTARELTIPYYGKVSLGIAAYPITLIWILGMTNAYNFMDGLNGLAAGVAVIVGLAFTFITFTQGSGLVFHISYIIAASCMGFLVINLHSGSIFMGDAGSTFIGFCFATIAILAANYDMSHTPFMAMPILLANFIMETLFTFMWRFAKGERAFEAHRTHPYQLLNRIGLSKKKVVMFYYLQSVILAICCYYYISIQSDGAKLGILMSIVSAELVYFAAVHAIARRKLVVQCPECAS